MTKSVKIYSTSTCPYCTMAKDFLKKNNTHFQEMNVGIDQAAAKEMTDKSGQMGVPVLDIDGTIIVGFDKDAISRALGIT